MRERRFARVIVGHAVLVDVLARLGRALYVRIQEGVFHCSKVSGAIFRVIDVPDRKKLGKSELEGQGGREGINNLEMRFFFFLLFRKLFSPVFFAAVSNKFPSLKMM